MASYCGNFDNVLLVVLCEGNPTGYEPLAERYLRCRQRILVRVLGYDHLTEWRWHQISPLFQYKLNEEYHNASVMDGFTIFDHFIKKVIPSKGCRSVSN